MWLGGNGSQDVGSGGETGLDFALGESEGHPKGCSEYPHADFAPGIRELTQNLLKNQDQASS
jgi:hypothetical protein